MRSIGDFPNMAMELVEKLENKIPNTIGYIYFIIANLFYAFLNMFVRIINGFPHFQLFYIRVLFPTALLYFIIRKQRLSLFTITPRVNRLMILNGITYLIGGSCIFYGFQVVPLSEAMVIFQTNPAVSGILAVFLLKETYDIVQILITLFCIFGVTLVAKPSFLFSSYSQDNHDHPERLQGILSLLMGSFAIGLMSVIIKKVVTHVDANLSAFYIGIIPSLFCSFFMVTSDAKMPSYDEFWIIVYIVILGFLAQVFYNRAFKFGDAGKVSIMAYSQILFACALDVYVLGTIPDFYSLLGAGFIFCCMFLQLYKSWTLETKVQS